MLKNRIVDNFPKGYQDMIYLEPFVGGGSIFFKKERSKSDIINDKDKNVINVYKGFQKYDFDKIKNSVDGKYNKEEFQKIKNSNPKSDYEKFIRNYLLFKLSFFGQQRANGNKSGIKLRHDYGKDLKGVKIYNQDYKNLIKKYDSENTFIYLDPPYEGSDKSHYIHSEFDYNELKDILENIKGKFLLSINDSPNIREIFHNFNKSTITTKYTDPIKGGQSKEKTELIIKNY